MNELILIWFSFIMLHVTSIRVHFGLHPYTCRDSSQPWSCLDEKKTNINLLEDRNRLYTSVYCQHTTDTHVIYEIRGVYICIQRRKWAIAPKKSQQQKAEKMGPGGQHLILGPKQSIFGHLLNARITWNTHQI